MRTTATASAPGRVNLIGEHTDYNDGFVLPLALERRCRATVHIRSGDGVGRAELIVASAQHPQPARIARVDVRPKAPWLSGADAWAAYAAGVVWALRDRLPEADLDIELDSDVPLGSGLSSSAAVICSVALALDALFELGLGPSDLVAATRQAENDFVGAPTGGMDQLVSLLGTAGHALLCDMRSLHTEQIPFDPDAAGLALVLVDSGVRHRNASGDYGARRRSCTEAARALGVPALRDATADQVAGLPDGELRRRARHVVTENARVLEVARLLRAGRVREVGPVLTTSHASMREDFEITVEEVDDLVADLLGAGALGARMTGGGFGGFVLALMPADRVDTVASLAADRPWFLAVPADGARLA